MAKPTDTVKPWATSGNYPASIYPINLPWGAPNPVGGDPTPWSAQPSLNAADITAFAASGHTPQIPTDASSQNRWNNTVYQCCDWVNDGTSDPDGDAHIMETDAIGLSKALAYEASASFQGAGSTKAPLANGALIPAGQELELAGSGKIAATNAATVETGILEFKTGGAAPTVRQMAVGTNNLPVYHDGTLKLMHISVNGYVYATGDQEVSAAMGLDGTTAQTSVALLGLGLGNVRVIVNGLIQISALPDTFELFLQENQTNDPAWTTIGASATIQAEKDTSNVDDWQPFRLERTFTAGTLFATLYRLRVRADPKTAAVKEVRVRVVPERS